MMRQLDEDAEVSAQPIYAPISYHAASPHLARLVPESFARAHKIVPLVRHGDVLTVAMADTQDAEALAELRRLMACEIRIVLSSGTEIDAALNRFLTSEESPNVWPAAISVLRETGFLTPLQIAALERRHLATEARAGLWDDVLAEEDYVEALGLAFHLPRIRLDNYRIVPAFGHLIPHDLAERWQLIAVFPIDGEMVVASPGLPPPAVLDDLKTLTGLEPRLALCTPSEARRGQERVYSPSGSKGKSNGKNVWEQLVRDRAVDGDQVAAAQLIGVQTGEPIEQVLLRLGQVNQLQILVARARLHDTKVARVGKIPIDRSVAAAIPEPIARARRCVAFRRLPQGVLVAMVDLADGETKKLLEVLFGQPVQTVICGEAELEEALSRVYEVSHADLSAKRPLLGEYLTRSGWLNHEQLQEGLELQRRAGGYLGRRLLDLGLITEERLAEMLGLQLRLPSVTLSRHNTPAQTLGILPEEVASLHGLVPLYREGRLLTVATSEPQNAAALRAAAEYSGLQVRAVLAGEDAIRTAVTRLYEADISIISDELREFGQSLVKEGLLTRDQLLQVWHRQLQADVPFDVAVAELGLLSDQQLAAAMADYLKLPQADLSYSQVPVSIVDGIGIQREVLQWAEPLDSDVARLLPENYARSFAAIPVRRQGHAIVVAFVNPLEEATRRTIQEQLGRPISTLISTRAQVSEAIRRVFNRKSLGDLLLEADAINRRQLEEGLELHRRTGVRLGRALISLGYVTQEQMVACLSQQQDIPYFSLSGIDIPEDVARSVPESLARKHGLIPLDREDSAITLAMSNPLDVEAIEAVESATGCRVKPVITTEEDIEGALERVYHSEYLWRSANDLVFRYPEESAIKVLSTWQKIFFLAFLGVSALLVALNPVAYFSTLVILSTIFYVSFSAYKFYLVYKALAYSLEVDVSGEEVAALDDRALPVYTVLVPLYREVEVLPNLLKAIDNLDYPKAKLDVKLLLEGDDEETIAAVRGQQLPAHFKVVIVPNSTPKGKPKACNYGLIHAQGEFVVIYDAEDIPDRDQLKKALVAFRKAPAKIGCIQAKLNYYNRDQNLLTRWFTTEYSMWFDLFMPGLDASNSPVPLGGTSNHFRTSHLQALGAWDPFNVTEDADLGVRMFKAGWKTAIIDSTTYEEANSELYNWIRQRSRWVKGYIQTYLVHMRHPIKLLRAIGPYQFFSFNMVVGGTFFGFLMNPFYWLLTALWFLTRWGVIQQLFPGPVFYIGALGLYFGNFAFTYGNVAGCMRRQYYEMVKYALLSPLYWAFMSVGAWKGFLQLFYRPSYWEKTVHGLYQGQVKIEPATNLEDTLWEAPPRLDSSLDPSLDNKGELET